MKFRNTVMGIVASMAVWGFSTDAEANLTMTLVVDGAIPAWSGNSTSGSFFQSGINPNSAGSGAPMGQFNNWSMDMDITADQDPLMTAVISLTNNTAFDQLFTIITTSTLFPITGTTFMGGSIQGTLTDENPDFFTPAQVSAPAGGSIYSTLVDGVATSHTLFNDPFSVSTVFAPKSLGSDNTGPAATAGIFGPVGATADFSIVLSFVLSAGDTVGFTSFFEIAEVPAPGAMGLLLLGGLYGGRRRRRRTF